ncbi:hypothetical protein [Paenibacillus kribbensis]|nr:hypothetical protein [Paenibacillus kribbensis]
MSLSIGEMNRDSGRRSYGRQQREEDGWVHKHAVDRVPSRIT